MKLRNKKTGEIMDDVQYRNYSTSDGFGLRMDGKEWEYHSIAEFNEDWEDVPEEKKGIIEVKQGLVPTCVHIVMATEEEAEKAVERLRAWKRLKDRGFRFEGIKDDYTRILQSQEPFRTGKRYLQFNKSEDEEWMKENWEDLDLLFGGEDD